MHVLIAIAVASLAGAVAQAAEPAARPGASAKPAAAAPSPTKSASAASRPPLKLMPGDVRKYMMPNEFLAVLAAPDADKTTIIVQGDRPAPKLKSEEPLPQGLGAYYSLVRHPAT